MKLEDEILKIVNKNLEVSMPNENAVIVKGQWEFVTDIKSLIERYCKRQREMCAGHFPLIQDPTTILTILEAKLATEE
jgi:hypothetical protein